MNTLNRIRMDKAARRRLAGTLAALLAAAWVVAPRAEAQQIAATPSPLVLMPRHSADTNGAPFVIDAAEAARTLAHWRANRYGVDGATADGYAPGGLATNGVRHDADYEAPAWQLGYHEIVRLLALHRAAGYRYDPATADGFRPNPDTWSYSAPAAGSTPGVTRYVSAGSTNPVAPYTSAATAAATLPDALNIAGANDLILVAPGRYNQGATTNYYGVSRVAITAAVTVASTMGPEVTVIEGASNGFVRGVFIQHAQASLLGFTVRNGFSNGNSTNLDARNGGGVLALAATNIAFCVLEDNSAKPWGTGGGISLRNVTGSFHKNLVQRNAAYSGAGISVMQGFNTVVQQNRVSSNTAEWAGGGLFGDNARKLYNMVIAHNHSKFRGGGADLGNNSELWHATLIANTASNNGAGLQFSGTGSGLRNSILHDHGGLDVVASFPNNSVRFCALPAGADAGLTAVSNVYAAPLLVHAAGGNYRIAPGSPTIDRGELSAWMTGSPDYDGRSRVQGPSVDIGAHEFNSATILAAPSYYIPGEAVPVQVTIATPAEHRLLTLGFAVSPPPGWQVAGVTGNVAIEASPDGSGYVATAGLSTSITATINLIAATNAAGAVPFPAIAHWMMAGDEQVRANELQPAPYQIQPLFPVAAIPQTGGSVSSTGGWYAIGSQVTLTAIPDAGWRFAGWSGSTNGAIVEGDAITIPVTGAATVHALFIRTYNVQVASLYGITDPPMGVHAYDTGAAVTVRVLDQAVTIGQTGYVSVGWSGTGSVPASGGDRAVTFTIGQDSSVTWLWSRFSAQHASRGYRAAGRMAAVVECDVWYEPSATLTQLWWKPVMSPGWTIHGVGGEAAPVQQGNVILVRGDLSSGHARFHYDATLPGDAEGVLTVGGEAGANAPP